MYELVRASQHTLAHRLLGLLPKLRLELHAFSDTCCVLRETVLEMLPWVLMFQMVSLIYKIQQDKLTREWNNDMNLTIAMLL